MLIATLLSGYFLVIGDFSGSHRYATTIPFEYYDKGVCEQAAKGAESMGLEYICMPVDTHTANEEFD